MFGVVVVVVVVVQRCLLTSCSSQEKYSHKATASLICRERKRLKPECEVLQANTPVQNNVPANWREPKEKEKKSKVNSYCNDINRR